MAQHDIFESALSIFDSLARNAFDFLERGIQEFDQFPKYSVIHFCAAVEMLLKARLMREHWSLIVSKPDQANLAKFRTGDFSSVSLEDARARIRDVAGDDIGKDASDNFLALAKHRNKMVHFFHHGLDDDSEAKQEIVAAHCRSWFHLHRLLNRWNGYFQEFSSEIAQADLAMRRHGKYLEAKFQALKPELDASRKAGNMPRACSACDFEAAVPDALDDQIASLRCQVCDHTETQVELDCPHCGESIVIANEGFSRCEHCEKHIEPHHLVDALTDPADACTAMKYGDDSKEPANCGNCEGYQTVVSRADRYFCTSCFVIFDRIEQCQWCNEYSTGDMEYSYANGYGQCEGKWGQVKND